MDTIDALTNRETTLLVERGRESLCLASSVRFIFNRHGSEAQTKQLTEPGDGGQLYKAL